jgi:di/tricarboxylate transporter
MDAIILGVILAIALFLFISEWVRIDVVAVLIMGALIVTGVLSPQQAVAGFSNSATVTVLFMFILSAALLKTGALNFVGSFFASMFNKSFNWGFIVMMVSVALVSAFINNTPVVAMFIPVVIQAAKESKIPASKLLMSVSFASIFGGMCTLIGTSTNILVDGIARNNGVEGFGMFTLAPVGFTLFVAGMLYMRFVGKKLLPDRVHLDKEKEFNLRDYVTEVELLEHARSAGKMIREAPLVVDYEMDILEVYRNEETFSVPNGDFVLHVGDILKVRSNVERLQKLKEKLLLSNRQTIRFTNHEFESKDTTMVELIITSNSRFEGKTMQEVNFRQRYRAIPLAIKHREDIIQNRLMNTALKAGDVILVEIKNNRLDKLKEEELTQNQPFILLTERVNNQVNWKNFALVIFCLLSVILLSTFEILDVLGGTLIASAILILTKCVPVKEIYDVIDWKVIFLLAGALSLGTAMEKTGISKDIANLVINTIGTSNPIIIVSALYLLTSIITEIMSNNASAALLAPIAISTAQQLELSPMPFLVAITLGASASFMTPVGYQTNTMVYGAGGYTFKDFTKVGAGLSILFWLIATFMIPLCYGF